MTKMAHKSSWKILVADDHELIRRGTRSLLESWGKAEVWEARHGNEAVEKARELKPDLVILDISMPLVDGFSAAREIRKFAPDIKILIFSVNKTEAFAKVADKLGVNGYLTKSESSGALLEMIEDILNDRKVRVGSAFSGTVPEQIE
jgi:DNA-binding NarL/FixJ family response regulator